MSSESEVGSEGVKKSAMNRVKCVSSRGEGSLQKGYQRLTLTEPRVLGTVCGNRPGANLVPAAPCTIIPLFYIDLCGSIRKG